jgi:serine/threonine-protein kinase
MRSDAIKPGDVIAGKYRVRAILSRSRGFLVEAFHTEFDQRVAIRVLSPALVDDKEVERFRREARTLAKLESEHVARIVDVGKTQDGAFFFARQYLEGQDLAATLKQRGALPLNEAVLYVLQAAEAVAECHANSILLRELQPSHLFLTQRLGGSPQIKVIDFGTAKLMREAAAPTAGGELTATSMFGLSCYSSPELVRKAQHVDQRTDVWSLGAILYQLLTARPPFEGEMAALMLAITRDEPVPVTRYRRDVPPEIDQISGWALAKDVDGRFANVHAFAHALTPYTSPEGHVLIQRIGEITQAAKRRKAAGPSAAQAAAMDRDNPVTVDGNDLLEEDDDDPRTAYRPPDAPVVSPTYGGGAAKPAQQEEAAPLERTLFIAPNYSPPSPSAGGGASPPGRPPAFAGAAADPQRSSQPHPSPPAWQPMASPAPAGAPAAVGAATPPPPAGNGAAQPLGPRAALATIQSSSIPHNLSGPKPQPKGAKAALAVVAGAVVLLSVVAVVVVLKGHPNEPVSGVENAASAKASTSASASAAPSASEVASASAAPSAEPAPPEPTPTQVASAPPQQPSSAPVGGKLAKNDPKPADPKPDKKAKNDPAPAPTPPPASGGGDSGTLVAVAVGGTCAFSVNGAAKGTTSTLKLSLKPGTYSVTCAPSTGASKSKSVTVTSGGTAMAMFKL